MEDFNGGFRIHTEQECDDTLTAVREAADLIPRKTKGDGATFVGSIPVVQALIFAKECGSAVGTREWAEYARKKMDGEFKRLKVER